MDDAVIEPSAPALGYPRSTFEEFVAAAEAERFRLHEEIASADRRAEDARAAASAYDVMLSVLVEAHGELTTRLADATRTAEQILEAARREARAIVQAERDDAEPADPSVAPGDERGGLSDVDAHDVDAHDIDLPMIEILEPERDRVAAPVFVGGNGRASDVDADPYFDFLRGALADEEPLGPRAD